MVSNDDINNNILQYGMENIISHDTTATGVAFFDTVPANKRWILRAISMHREYIGDMKVYLTDPLSGQIFLEIELGSLNLIYQPPVPVTMGEGWSILTAFFTGVSGTLNSNLVIDEQIIY